MTLPAFGAAGTHLTGANRTSAAVAVPAGVTAGQIVVVHLYKENTAAVTKPDVSWTEITPSVATTGSVSSHHIFWKRATASDSGTYTFSWTGSVWSEAIATRYTGAIASGNPFDTGAGAPNGAQRSSNGNVTPAVSLTTQGADRLLIWSGTNFASGTWTAPTVPSAFTLRSTASASALSVATVGKATAGATGSVTGSCTGSSFETARVLALLPVGGTTFAQTITDPVGITDTQSRAATFARSKTDPIGVTDTATRAASRPRAKTEAVGLTDSVSYVKTGPQFIDLGIGDITVTTPTPVVAAHTVRLGVGDVHVEILPVELQGTTLRTDDITVTGLPLQVSYGSNAIGGRGGLVAVPPAPTTRFIAQVIRTNQILSWDLEINDAQVTDVLSGPQSITGSIKPEQPEVRELFATGGFEPWGCWIHQEVDGVIQASGILQPYQIDGEVLQIEAAGISAYPHGIPYLDELSGIQIDPADVVRAIWAHVQSYPDGNLHVTVNGTTAVKIGEPAGTAPRVDGDGNPVLDDDGHQILDDVEAKPYQLSWWEGTDCGSEIDNLAQQAPFDYVERQAWNADRTAVNHWIDIGYPRLGIRQVGLRFASGENVTDAVPAEESDDLYASQVVTFGKGEGRDTIHGYAGRPVPSRLRRVAIVQDATIATTDRANAVSADDLERRQGLVDVTDIEIDARHLNAQLGSFSVGDDIPLDVEVGWLGRLQQWERVLSITYSPDGEVARLQLRRADAFRYGGTA